jgi:hypothetical protein
MPDDQRDHVSRAELETLVGIAEVQEMMSRGRRKVIRKSYAIKVTNWPGFPAPLIRYPREGRLHVRLWLLADVESWLDRNRPGWRHLPPAPTG